MTSLWPGLHLSTQTVCLLAPWGAGCRHGGSGWRVKGALCLESRPPPGAHVHAHPPVLPAGRPSLADDLASPDPVEIAGIFALHPSSVPWVVLCSSLAGPILPLQTQAMCSEAECLAALSLVPRALGHQSPAGNILLFLLLVSGVFCSFCCTQLCSFLNAVFETSSPCDIVGVVLFHEFWPPNPWK